MAKTTKRPSSNSSSGDAVEALKAQIDAKKEELMRLRLEDVTDEVAHQTRINQVKNEIRNLTEQVWDGKRTIATNKVEVGNVKVQDSSEDVTREQTMSELKRTLADEKVTRMKRKIYEQIEEVAD